MSQDGSIQLDISCDEEEELLIAVRRMLSNCYQLGRESQPEIYHFEKPCICTKYDGEIKVVVDGHLLQSKKAIVYALIYRARTAHFRYVISHQCGAGPNCIEPTHLNIVLRGENNAHRGCHRAIRLGVDVWQHPSSDKTEAEREGTIFLDGCKHTNHPCFKQFGRLKPDEEIWPYGRIIYDPGFGFSTEASEDSD